MRGPVAVREEPEGRDTVASHAGVPWLRIRDTECTLMFSVPIGTPAMCAPAERGRTGYASHVEATIGPPPWAGERPKVRNDGRVLNSHV